MKKKIAIYQYDLDVGGIQKSLINLLSHLNSEYEIDLYLFSKDKFFDFKFPNNVNLFYLKPFVFFAKFIPFKILYRLVKYKNDKEYDVSIDFNSYKMETSVCSLKTKATRKVIWCHNDVEIKLREEKKYRILWSFFNKKYFYFDFVCAVSNGVKDSFCKITNFKYNSVIVIPNYIDTEDIIRKSQEKISINIDASNYNLVTLGRITHQKGLDSFLPIYSKVLQKRQDMHFYIIGDGEDKELIEKISKNLNLENKVTFLGNQNNPFKFLSKMDGFVLNSRYEGQGMVVLEAECLGLETFFPIHLEKYLDGFKGKSNLEKALIEATKNNCKHVNRLEEYNNNILLTFERLCDVEEK